MNESLIHSIRSGLDVDPTLDAARISIDFIEDQLVLAGTVRSYSEQCRAAELARSLAGRFPLSNQLEVRLSIGHYRTDAGLAHLTNELLENHVVLGGSCHALVDAGWVTLQGRVESDFVRSLAESAIRELAGVRGITNEICVVSRARPQREAR